MKPWPYIVASCVGALFYSQVAFGEGTEMEILLKKLQEKGILTADEAQSIAKETKQAAEAEKKEMKESVAKESGVPDWVKTIKLKGDLRLRYQNEDREDNGQGSRGRERIRLRFGADAQITDKVSAGFGLASGSGDPRSTNQTLENTFQKKSVTIDYAYAKYQPVKAVSLLGGKFENPVWRPSDLLWDTDITPEGVGLNVNVPIASSVNLLFNSGAFVLDERSGAKDPLMYAFQPGVKWNITKNAHIKVMGTYYGFSNVRGNTLDLGGSSITATNTLDEASKLKFDYNAPALAAEIGFKNPFGSTFIPYVGFFGEYIRNSDPDDNNTGYIAGATVGHQSMRKFGDWSLEYTFRRLEKDAWLDVFPDSDFFGGNTNAMGHRAKFNFGLTKNVSLGLNYFNSWKIRNFSPATGPAVPFATRDMRSDEHLFQADLVVKF